MFRAVALLLLGLCGPQILQAETNAFPNERSLSFAGSSELADKASVDAKVKLGKQLFFDPRLSGDQSVSCASCHHPGLGWSDGLPRNTRFGGEALSRHTPTLINVAYYTSFFWDGRASSLEEQAAEHLRSPSMRGSEAFIVADTLAALPEYRRQFQQAFGKNAISLDNIAAAIAAFERTIISSNSPFDRWQAGDQTAISESAKRGFKLFTTRAMCTFCHNGPNFSDSRFHNIGVNSIDPGRFEVSNSNSDRNAFKTPGLRHIALTPPYMHDGSKVTLRSVLEFYNRGGDRPGGGNKLSPLGLSDAELDDLLAFLLALTGEAIEVTVPQLPLPELDSPAARDESQDELSFMADLTPQHNTAPVLVHFSAP
ncbi:MAG: cytochrome c peroxidase [Mariprofundaceae bacterium]